MIMTMDKNELYAVADIGSNTVVLIVYELIGGVPAVKEYLSDAAHLIDTVKDGRMSAEGIEKAYTVLSGYARHLDELDIQYRYADITEPGRISNRDELVSALRRTGFTVVPLSGSEEAVLDYEGARLAYPDIETGAAFDVGGGSSELITFRDGRITTALSVPLGCVRLSRYSLDDTICKDTLQAAMKQYPALSQECDTLIGIGGTMRAVGLVSEKLYGSADRIAVQQLQDLFTRLRAEEQEAVRAMEETVSPSRIPVFLPGIHMILAIAEAFRAEEIVISPTGIREGFLLKMLKSRN